MHLGESYVVHDGFDYSPILNEGGERFTVPLTMIDSLELPRVSGVKLDVENFEAHVLRGATDLLKRDHPIIYCELWDTPNRQEVMSLLGQLRLCLRENGYEGGLSVPVVSPPVFAIYKSLYRGTDHTFSTRMPLRSRIKLSGFTAWMP